MTTFTISFVFSALLVTSGAIPVAQTGLGAALTNIANSFVVVSEDINLQPNSTSLPSPPLQDAPTALHLESANVLPSLVHISITPEEHHIKAETAELVYTNDTDAQGVVKITIVSEEEESSGESTTDTTTEPEDADDVTTETTIVEADELTTTELSTSTGLPTTIGSSTTPGAILTVLGADQVDKEKEDEIKENIKEVEAMPVILTVGV